jgi:hypothetical protein
MPPAVEVVVYRPRGRAVVGLGPPSATALVPVADGMDHLAQAGGAAPAPSGGGRHQRSQQVPLGIGRVRGLRLARGLGFQARPPGRGGKRAPQQPRFCRIARNLSRPF